ncbi:ATP-binding protein [Streptomyces sp. NPDC051207]|uniref:ATP-binding protein n=1 Tax=Streptomyces sp. NPDC051207 TaxID=3154641 RepID=UPI003430BA2A
MELTDGTSPTAHGGSPPGTPVSGEVTSAAGARAYAASVVRRAWDAAAGAGPREEDVIDLLLVVSELVTNAIRHGGGLAGFEAWAVEDGLRVAVHDHSPVVPAVAYGPGSLPVGHRGSGYGWPLILRLAREIAIDRRPEGGKTITVLVPVRTASGRH